MLRTKPEEAGLQVLVVLRRAGLAQDFFNQPWILGNTQELFALCLAIGDLCKDPCVGFKVGAETKPEQFHPRGIAALSAETLGLCIDYMAKYTKLFEKLGTTL